MSCAPKHGASSLTRSLYFALGLIQAFEAVQGTIMFSIMPFIVAEFYRNNDLAITEKELEFRVGQGSGILLGSFFLAAFLSSFFWGWASDYLGRRPVLLLGTAGSIVATALFAMCNTFPSALAARFVVGILNGNLGVLKSYLGEVTTSENQASAFAYISAVYAAMSVISPLAGGVLGGIVQGMPFAFLPGMVSATFGSIVLFLCYFFLPETMAFQQRKRRESPESLNTSDNARTSSRTPVYAIIRDRKIVLAILLYANVCILHIAIITLLPMFFRAERTSGGLDIPSSQVGALFAVEGLSLCMFQMFCYPQLARRFGIISLLQKASMLLAVSMLLPLVCLYATNHFSIGHWFTTVPLMIVVGLPSMACFTSTNLLVNNSASDDIRGSVNGLGQTLGCMMRCLGPIALGTLWAFSTVLKAPYLPFVVLFISSFSLYGLSLMTPSDLLYPRQVEKATLNSPSEYRATSSTVQIPMKSVNSTR